MITRLWSLCSCLPNFCLKFVKPLPTYIPQNDQHVVAMMMKSPPPSSESPYIFRGLRATDRSGIL